MRAGIILGALIWIAVTLAIPAGGALSDCLVAWGFWPVTLDWQ